ncbi:MULTISPECIES: hypothetical protein [unclassified Brevibacillus]|uniref:hypothetical protein n=1 Tax=unclassified Brevibacillus TaxID=2684853 RepID=UPI003564A2E2
MVFCKNPDEDMVHAHEFSSKKELSIFIMQNGNKCPLCNAPLHFEDIRVAFLMKEQPLV